MTCVSVVIPTFNRRERVCRAILSVLNQTFGGYEIIVVDDGSTDGTSGEMDKFGDRIIYIRNLKNRGVSAARNIGIGASNFELIAFLDSDDHWMPAKLETQVKFFKDNLDAVACQTEEIWIRGGIRVNPGNKHLKPSGDIFRQSLKLCLVSPSAVMLKRSLLEEVGLFDEEMPVCEDYDLWLRIGCRHKIHLIEKKLVVKEGGAPDQLSARYRGMDRFRIMSMMKLLNSGELSCDQIGAVRRELEIKCRIYGEGCIKRGRKEEGEYYLLIPDVFKR